MSSLPLLHVERLSAVRSDSSEDGEDSQTTLQPNSSSIFHFVYMFKPPDRSRRRLSFLYPNAGMFAGRLTDSNSFIEPCSVTLDYEQASH